MFHNEYDTKRGRLLPLSAVAAGALALTTIAAGLDPGSNDQRVTGTDQAVTVVEDLLDGLLAGGSGARLAGGDEIPLETLKFFIEFNETDEDVGVQCVLGGEPYKVLKAYDPNERKILDLRPRRNLRAQGLSDFFFESAEPELSEFSMEEFLARFPAGEYEFETITLDNLEQEGETDLTHTIPAGPVIISPKPGDSVGSDEVVVEWEAVTMTTEFNPPQVPVDIVGYQVIVTREDPLRAFAADVGPDTLSITVPEEFLDPGTEYEVEVLAIEASDNQTISIIFFETEE